MKGVAALAILVLRAPALVAAPLDPGAFEALTTGRTFFYTLQGRSYGAEQYLPGHRVIWAFTGQDCEKGEWQAKGDQICFSYESLPGAPQCWTFRQTAEGLEGYFVGGPADQPPLVARQSSPTPMACLGPDVGV